MVASGRFSVTAPPDHAWACFVRLKTQSSSISLWRPDAPEQRGRAAAGSASFASQCGHRLRYAGSIPTDLTSLVAPSMLSRALERWSTMQRRPRRSGSHRTRRWRKADSNHRSRSEKSGRSETRASASCIAHGYGVAAAGETCGLNSANLNILSEARIHAPELTSDQVSVDPIEEVLCSSLVSREVRR